MNRQPYGTPPRWWAPRLSPWWIRRTRGIRLRRLRGQQVIGIETVGEQHLSDAVAADNGVLIVPNHATHYDSEALYAAADHLGQPLYYMIAWQVFAAADRVERWVMQRLGCFSINRESTDRRAFRQAVQVLSREPHPLVVFPEGDIYHISDRVMPFRDGAAAVALSAAKRAARPVVVVPCGIRFNYVDDPRPSLRRVVERLEQRLALSLDAGARLDQRVRRIADAALRIEEERFLGAARAGPLRPRMNSLADHLLVELETRHTPHDNGDQTTPGRVKRLRQKIIDKLEQSNLAREGNADSRMLECDLDACFLVMQLYSYPPDYLEEGSSIGRLAETIDKLEEDVLGIDCPTVHGRRRVVTGFGEPIPVAKPEHNRRDMAARLTRQMEAGVQLVLDQLSHQQVRNSARSLGRRRQVEHR